MLPELVSVVVPRRSGGYIAATQTGFCHLDIDTGTLVPFASPNSGLPNRRFNDGKCDAMGRLWAGTLALDGTPGHDTLYRLDPDGTLHEIETGFHVCNGMGWSPDSTRFYLTDSGSRTIFVYDFDLTHGRPSNKRVLKTFDATDGKPDGLAVDADGYLWCAMWDGNALKRLTPDGRLDRTIALPVPRPTSCAFGGDDLKTLYITTARAGLSEAQLDAAPLSGSVLSLTTDVAGAPVGQYGDQERGAHGGAGDVSSSGT